MDDQSRDHGGLVWGIIGHRSHEAFGGWGLYSGHARHGHSGFAVYVTRSTAFDALESRFAKFNPLGKRKKCIKRADKDVLTWELPISARKTVLRFNNSLLAEIVLPLVDTAARSHGA